MVIIILFASWNDLSSSTKESNWENPSIIHSNRSPRSVKQQISDLPGSPKHSDNSPLLVRNLSSESIPYSLPFGFVMRDFSRRVLSRHISNSNVLVISSDATAAAKDASRGKKQQEEGTNPYDTVDFESPYSVGGTFLLHAAAENHTLHAIDAGVDKEGRRIEWSRTLDDWWASFGSTNIDLSTTKNNWWSSSRVSQPKWIIATVFDLPFGHEDYIWNGAEAFLRESTATYLVVSMHSRKVGYNEYEYGGLAAANALLGHRYKLQTLMVSHYHVNSGEESYIAKKYGVNALIKSLDEMKDFLRWGADSAIKHGTVDVFTAYIFATQSLDLAIPSNSVFLNGTSRVISDESTTQINLYKPVEFKQCPQATVKQKLNIQFGKVSFVVMICLE